MSLDIDAVEAELKRLREIERCAKVLLTLVPSFWWDSPPNQATKDVVDGIKAFGLDPDEWRNASKDSAA